MSRALLLMVLLLIMGQAAAGSWSYGGELGAGYDSNLGNAGDDHDTRDSVAVFAGASATWEQRFGLYSAVQLRGNLATDQYDDIADLSNVRGSLRVRGLHKPGKGFHTPVLGASLAIGLRDYGSAIRDGGDLRAGVSLAAPLTTALQWRLEAAQERRTADGRAFDLDTTSYSLDLDWRVASSTTLYGGVRRDDGQFAITARGEGVISPKREHLYLEPIADVIEADAAFGNDWWAFRVEAEALIGTAGLNVALTPDLSLDLQALRAQTTVGKLSYERWIGSLGLLARF
ncbi:MAG: hypothetical protein ACT4PK_00100 [Gammaproteobacteria bacterium]